MQAHIPPQKRQADMRRPLTPTTHLLWLCSYRRNNNLLAYCIGICKLYCYNQNLAEFLSININDQCIHIAALWWNPNPVKFSIKDNIYLFFVALFYPNSYITWRNVSSLSCHKALKYYHMQCSFAVWSGSYFHLSIRINLYLPFISTQSCVARSRKALWGLMITGLMCPTTFCNKY